MWPQCVEDPACSGSRESVREGFSEKLTSVLRAEGSLGGVLQVKNGRVRWSKLSEEF